MTKETMTVRIPSATREALDALAAAIDRDRSYVVNEALSAYLELHRWHLEHIRQGLREAQEGRFVSDARVKQTLSRLRRK